MSEAFSEREKAILAIAQGDLPDSLTPYADMAAMAGSSEEEVLALLRRLKGNGAIRRFGASLRHQKAGWTSNAMVAWKATPEEADACGALIAENPSVSHAYYRPSPGPEWPYAFYTMVHGRSEAECDAVIADLARKLPLREYKALRSRRELKKTSMTYFPGKGQND